MLHRICPRNDQVMKDDIFEDAIDKSKLHPKLRMVLNGSATVNTYRAERCASLSVVDPTLLQITKLRDPGNLPLEKSRGPKEDVSQKPSGICATVFIRLTDAQVELPEDLKSYSTAGYQDIIIAEIPLNKIEVLEKHKGILEVVMGENLVFHPPFDLAIRHNKDVRIDSLSRVPVTSRHIHKDGAGVMIGIIDVQGYDFSHPDFLDAHGKTRFAYIWDQGGDTRPAPQGYTYGAEIRAEHIDAALAAAPKIGLAAYELEPQSQMTRSSHATHVAGIAAGTTGVAPGTTIVGVSLSLAAEQLDKRQSFFDSTRLAHAIEYILEKAQAANAGSGMPVVINISLGTNGHAHDGSSPIAQWIDSNFTKPGRCICVAAGNAGQDAPSKPGDLGFLSGRIHTGGVLPAAGLSKNIEWIVAGGGIADLSENELEIWYSMQDKFAVSLRPPGSSDWIGPVEPGQFIENKHLDNGTFVSIYNERYAPANGDNYIACFLSPPLSALGTGGVEAGIWLVRLHAREVRNGEYHGWIERDDPRRYGRLGVKYGWSFPSFFSKESNVDNSSVTSLGCAQRVITVGSLNEQQEAVHFSSSQGPSRDGRQKPEILAPGVAITAANGFDLSDQQWVQMTGSSMASPYVAGVAALMLAIQPNLTTAQIMGIMRRTAKPLPGSDYIWKNDAGFGAIDANACILEAAQIHIREDISHQ